jgi:flagellar protein FlbD
MIQLTRLNGSKLVINALLVEMIEATPDTVVSLTNGKKVVVKESVHEIIRESTEYFRRVGLIGKSYVSGVEETDGQ